MNFLKNYIVYFGVIVFEFIYLYCITPMGELRAGARLSVVSRRNVIKLKQKKKKSTKQGWGKHIVYTGTCTVKPV